MKTYFIFDGTAVKIGVSRNVPARLYTLQTASSRPLTLLMVQDGNREKALHQAFAAHRLSGEWFTTAVLDFYPWLLCQTDRNDDIGDLARDAAEDRHFPVHENYYREVLRAVSAAHAGRSIYKLPFVLAGREWARVRRRAGLPVPHHVGWYRFTLDVMGCLPGVAFADFLQEKRARRLSPL